MLMGNCRLFALVGVTCAMCACGGEVAGITSSTNPSGSNVGGRNAGNEGNGVGSGNDTLFASGGSTNGSGNTGNTGGTLGRSGTGGSSDVGGTMVTSGAPGTGGNGPCLPENVCTATTCGSQVDACGNVVDCGYTNCAQSICGAADPNTGIATRNGCPFCGTTTCATEGKNCGTILDGCGATLDCGTCTEPECCGCAPDGSTGVPNVCASYYIYRGMGQTCAAGTRGCLCDSKGGCAPGLTCNTTRNPYVCCSGTDCSLSPPPLATCSGTGVAQCNAGITIPTANATTDSCGYSITSFSENAFICGLNAMSEGTGPALIQGFFNDEWPLTLGCATSTNPVSPMTTATVGGLMYPQLGDLTCNDANGRPMRPTLFITDITADLNCKAGDQQAGGVPYDPIGLFGTWTYADSTGTPVRQSSIPMNYWTLGTGADPLPASVSNQCPCTAESCPGSGFTGKGYGSEVLYEVALVSGHSYRLQFMAHDGDQSQSGDSGETCINFCAGSGCMTKTCEQVCTAPSGGKALCATAYDPAVYTVACPKSDGCAGIMTCYCPTG